MSSTETRRDEAVSAAAGGAPRPFTRGTKVLLAAALIALAALAWSGLLEDYSEDYVNQAFTGAGVIYATARGINALVSVLQGTELDVVFVTVAIGEALDPINDLIERFSEFVLIALGSLAMQKILLGLVSHQLFNALLTLLAVVVMYCLLRGNRALYRPFFGAFLVTAFLRFSLGLVVLANNWVDSTFLREQDQQRHAAMESFRGELREASSLAGAGGSSEQPATQKQGWWDSMTSKVSAQQLRDKISELEAGVDAFAENVIDLLVSLLLKSIAIPLLFFYLLLRVVRSGWSKLS